MRADDVIEALDVLDRAGVLTGSAGAGGWSHSPAGRPESTGIWIS
jgi:hypothetical protein